MLLIAHYIVIFLLLWAYPWKSWADKDSTVSHRQKSCEVHVKTIKLLWFVSFLSLRPQCALHLAVMARHLICNFKGLPSSRSYRSPWSSREQRLQKQVRWRGSNISSFTELLHVAYDLAIRDVEFTFLFCYIPSQQTKQTFVVLEIWLWY